MEWGVEMVLPTSCLLTLPKIIWIFVFYWGDI